MNDDGKNKEPDAAFDFDLRTFIILTSVLMRSQRINDQEEDNTKKNSEEYPKQLLLIQK